MRFSQGITEHADLDAVTGARIEAALRRQFPAFDDHLATLTGPGGTQPLPAAAALLAAAGDAGLRDLALAVVSAWYTGTVGAGKDAAVVSYAEALMYRTVADGQVVPTYCNYGPQWWTKAPPEAGVSAPEVSKAPPPATTGIPEPKNSTRP
ncbi:MAG: Fructose dehydrogenase small subunit [Xylophilus sp.]|nr:MAG: Fructose dehydrogenase small subunit [Xylophilus sp.]